MKKTWVIIALAVAAILPVACSAAAKATSSNDPVVSSTTGMLAGEVIKINGITYNCIIAREGSLGIAVWCDKLSPSGQ